MTRQSEHTKLVEVTFVMDDSKEIVLVPVERPEWLCGGTFMALSSNHRLAQGLKGGPLKRNAINPVTKEQIPIWIADYAGTDVHLGVPAHDEADRKFATHHGLPVVPVVAQDFGEPLPDAKDVTGVVVIGYDPQSGQFMGLKSGGQGRLVSGGREKDESYEDAARRELTEEAGFSQVIKLIPLGDPVYSYYYNDIKGSNRRSLGYNYLAVVDRTTQHDQQLESHEDFTVWWTGFDELYCDVEKTGGGIEHWLMALNRAKLAASAHDNGHLYQTPCYTGDGTMVNAGPYDGLPSRDARLRILQGLEANYSTKIQV